MTAVGLEGNANVKPLGFKWVEKSPGQIPVCLCGGMECRPSSYNSDCIIYHDSVYNYKDPLGHTHG